MTGLVIVLVIAAGATALVFGLHRHAARPPRTRHPSGRAAATSPTRSSRSRDLTPEFRDAVDDGGKSDPSTVETDPLPGQSPIAAHPRRRPMTWDEVDPGLRQLVATKISQLSTLPTMMTQLLALLQDSDSDPREIARTASTDPAVVAEVLRTVNSSFYGIRTRISDISRAVLMLGYSRVKLIVMSLGVHTSLNQSEDYKKRLGNIWRHSFLTSEAVAHLNKSYGGWNDPNAPTAALLHDLGKLFLLDLQPRSDLDVGVVFRSESLTAEERIFVEEDYFGVNHCLIGERIADKLQLSEVVKMVQSLHHHALDDPQITVLDRSLIGCIASVKLGNLLANEYAKHANDAEPRHGWTAFFPNVEPYRRFFPALPDWERLAAECERPLREAWSFLGSFLPPDAALPGESEAPETPTSAGDESSPAEEHGELQSIAGRYKLIEKVGEGSIGAVYLCEDVLLGQQFAIKVMRSDTAQSSSALQVFLNEVKITLNLAHPNIVRVFHFDQRDGVTFILQEFLEGRSLSNLLVGSGPRGMDEQRVLAVATQLVDALAYAHDHGVIHRDLSPNNVIVDAEGRIKLLDFGIAACKALHGAGEADSWGYVAGTASYMSPEHWLGIDKVDPRSDIYSLGVVLYQLLSGKLPFTGSNQHELRQAQIAGEVAPLPAVSAPMNQLVLRCLEASPDARWPDCRTLAEQLRSIERQVPIGR